MAVNNRLYPERCVAATLWGEARGEPWLGKIAVAWVIRNRVYRPAWWGKTWQEVCLTQAQFTCWSDEQERNVRTVDVNNHAFVECLWATVRVMDGAEADPTHGADHYHTKAVAPKWARTRTPTATIGHHKFFKLGPDGNG